MKVRFRVPYEDSTFLDFRDNQDNLCIAIGMGNAAGKMIMLDIPTAQVVSAQRVEQAGLAYTEVVAVSRMDEHQPNNDTEIRRQNFSIHFL